MANKVTAEDIVNFNKIYYGCKNYSEVARQTGFSAATVRKYVDKDWKPVDGTRRKVFDPHSLSDEMDTSAFVGVENYGDLCVLSEEERMEIQELWQEMEI